MSYADRDARYALLTRRIPEDYVTNHEVIYTALANDKKRPRILWLTSPTGRPHLGYMIPYLKFVEFLRADCEIVIVLLDSYSYIDNVKCSWDQLMERMQVYRYTVEAAMVAMGVDPKKLTFVQESHHEVNEKWIKDCWKMCTLVKQQEVKDSWDRAVHPDMLSPLLAPVHQSLCEEYLDADIQFGGYDQFSLFAFGDRVAPKMGYRLCGHIMNPMLPNLLGGKMSSSHPSAAKLMFCEDPEVTYSKLYTAYEDADDKFNCGVMTILANILIPFSQLQEERACNADKMATKGIGNAHQAEPFWTEAAPSGTVFTVQHNSQVLHFDSYEQIVSALKDGRLTFETVVPAIITAVIQLCGPIRKIFQNSVAWQTADRLSYPEEYTVKQTPDTDIAATSAIVSSQSVPLKQAPAAIPPPTANNVKSVMLGVKETETVNGAHYGM